MYIIRDIIQQSRDVLDLCMDDRMIPGALQQAADICVEALRNAKKIIVIGNGGSAAQAQHLAAELSGRFSKLERPGLGAMTLCGDVAALTAIGNDYGYDKLFSRQLEALGRGGDVLIALTTSGRSKNVIQAMEMAVGMQIKNIGMGGRIWQDKVRAHCFVNAPSDITARIQECHTLFCHILCQLIEYSLFEDPYGKKH